MFEYTRGNTVQLAVWELICEYEGSPETWMKAHGISEEEYDVFMEYGKKAVDAMDEFIRKLKKGQEDHV